jgi:hypothetical protein
MNGKNIRDLLVAIFATDIQTVKIHQGI